jgi:hypothetical protein
VSIIKLNNRSVKDITAFGSISSLGSLTHIATQTASSSSSINFTSGIDSTYKEYIFFFINIHASSNSSLGFKASINGGSAYGIATTTSAFMAEQGESDDTFLGYRTSEDHAQDTGLIKIGESYGTDNDQSGSGFMHLFEPSSTTFVKHFIAQNHSSHPSDYADNSFKAGYINTTSAVDAIQFSMTSGNIDSGDIILFGLN